MIINQMKAEESVQVPKIVYTNDEAVEASYDSVLVCTDIKYAECSIELKYSYFKNLNKDVLDYIIFDLRKNVNLNSIDILYFFVNYDDNSNRNADEKINQLILAFISGIGECKLKRIDLSDIKNFALTLDKFSFNENRIIEVLINNNASIAFNSCRNVYFLCVPRITENNKEYRILFDKNSNVKVYINGVRKHIFNDNRLMKFIMTNYCGSLFYTISEAEYFYVLSFNILRKYKMIKNVFIGDKGFVEMTLRMMDLRHIIPKDELLKYLNINFDNMLKYYSNIHLDDNVIKGLQGDVIVLKKTINQLLGENVDKNMFHIIRNGFMVFIYQKIINHYNDSKTREEINAEILEINNQISEVKIDESKEDFEENFKRINEEFERLSKEDISKELKLSLDEIDKYKSSIDFNKEVLYEKKSTFITRAKCELTEYDDLIKYLINSLLPIYFEF
jgi:hypothetical protein